MKAPTSKKWNWTPGPVDARKEHIKVTYGKITRGKITGDVRKPVALLAQGRDNTFLVQFLVDKEKDEKTKQMLRDVRRELNFFLVKKGEENPWAYAKYHCGAASNLYSSVHWNYYAEGSEEA